jgi:8-oxo-dGTP diphosphatase
VAIRGLRCRPSTTSRARSFGLSLPPWGKERMGAFPPGQMDIFEATTNPFGGVIPTPDGLPAEPEPFEERLGLSLDAWKAKGYRVVWLELPLDKAALVPMAADRGFTYHHATEGYVMMTLPLIEGAFVPAYASHYIGAGGVALNDRDELLVVTERRVRSGRPGSFKLPGGALHAGEHLQEAVVREVLEETGVRTRFESLVCFRHQHEYRHGKSDIYFVCLLTPLSHEITKQAEEIEECIWMPVRDYFEAESVSLFNKDIVRAALDSPGLVSTEVRGYPDPQTREFFMPRDGASP